MDLYFPIPSDIRVNPKNKKYALMQLYDVNRIIEIEHLEVFKEELRKLLERRRKRLINKQLNGWYIQMFCMWYWNNQLQPILTVAVNY